MNPEQKMDEAVKPERSVVNEELSDCQGTGTRELNKEVSEDDAQVSNEPDQKSSGHQQVNEQSSSQEDGLENEECVQLSENIIMYRKKTLCKSAHVYCGLMKNGIFGDQKIAIKYLQKKVETIKEAKLLHELGFHPNVVQFYHTDVYDEGPFPAMYIAMELCRKLNLHDQIIKNKKDRVPFDPERSLLHAKQITLGVDFIHKKGIINRDLKPQNILISLDGENLKVADFGLSKPLRHGRSMTRQSFLGAGTDGYRAPETYNHDEISLFSDIYSLALIFYFIWSYGCHPFGDDHDDWNSNIKKNRDRDLSRLLILDKDSAYHLLDWMLQMIPKKRPTTVEILDHPMFNKSSTMQIKVERPRENIPPTRKKQDDNAGKKLRPEPLKGSPRYERRPVGKIEPVKRETPVMDERKVLEAIIEEENCQHLMNESKFVQALLKLNDLVTRGRNELSTQLMIAECNLQIGRDGTAREVIKGIGDMVMAPGSYQLHEIKALVDETSKSLFSIRSVILLPYLSQKYKTDTCPNEAVDNIETCIGKIHEVFVKEAKVGGRPLIIIFKIAFPSMYEMLEDLRSITEANPHLKSKAEATSLGYIGGSFHEMDDHNKAVKYYEQAIDVLERRFGSQASRNRIYGHILHNYGISCENLGRCTEAEQFFERSILAEEQAMDFNDDQQRMESIKKTMNMLDNLRNRWK